MTEPSTIPNPSDSLRRTFANLGPAEDVPVEDSFHPSIGQAAVNNNHVRLVWASSGAAVVDNDVPPVFLHASTGNQLPLTEAYALIPNKPSISLHHHAPGWGEIHFAVVYPRVNNNNNNNNDLVFAVPQATDAVYVAIKILNKAVVQRYLEKGGEENPYKELERMQQLGDNVHVLSCRAALETETNLYIVTLKGEATLVDVIKWGHADDVMDTEEARAIFVHLLRILAYLHLHGICHRDFSPDNILKLPNGHWCVMDMAMSHKLPFRDGVRTLCNPCGNFGTYGYMAPEIYCDRIFCGLFSDMWSAGVMLYNLLTNLRLYHMPIPGDISFRYNILAKALSSAPLNERALEVLQSVYESDEADRSHTELFERAMAHLNMPPEAVELLENLLCFPVQDRWSLATVLECNFCTGNF